MISAFVCQSVFHAVGCGKTAERIDVLLGMKTLEGTEHCIKRRFRFLSPRRRGFDAAFAKLLWPLVIIVKDQLCDVIRERLDCVVENARH